MTRADRQHDFHLMAPAQLCREVVGGSANRNHVVSCDDYFALWNQDAIDVPAVRNAGNSAAQISPNNRIHDVSRQPYDFRQERFCTQHSHFDFPSPHARVSLKALSATVHNGKKQQVTPYQYLPSSMFQRSEPKFPPSIVHSVSIRDIQFALPSDKTASVNLAPGPSDAVTISQSANGYATLGGSAVMASVPPAAIRDRRYSSRAC